MDPIDQIILQGENAIISAGGESFARTQGAALDDLSDGTVDGIAEGTSNGTTGNGDPLDAYGLRSGYSGTGYLDYEADSDEVLNWTLTVPEAGTYDLHIRYANGSQARPLDILVNGAEQVSSESFASTGFANWVVKTLTISLDAGENSLALAIAGSNFGPNIDALIVTSQGEAAVFPPANTAPTFDDVPAVFAVEENETAVGSIVASDADADTVAYTLGGTDAALFTITSAGELSFVSAPAFDEAGTNTYAVEIIASDGELTTTQAVSVTVTEAAADPFTPIVIQGESAVTSGAATRVLTQTNAANEGTSGTNNDVFNLRPDYSGSGYLDFGGSNNGGESATYTFTSPVAGTFELHLRYASSGVRFATLTDGAGTEQVVSFAGTAVGGGDPFDDWGVTSVVVTLVEGENTLSMALFDGLGPNIDAMVITAPGEQPDFGPRFTTVGALTVEDGETAAGFVVATDVDDDTTDGDDAPGPVTFAIVGGADAAAFTVDPASGALSLVSPADAAVQAAYEVVVSATDAAGNVVEQAVTVTVDPNDAPEITGGVGPVSVPSGGGLVSLAALTVTDPEDDPTTLAVRLAGGGAAPAGVEIDGDGNLVIPGNLEPGELALEIVASDGALFSAPVAVTVTVEAPGAFSTTIQLETRNGPVTIDDDTAGGTNNANLTQVRDAQNTEGNTTDGKGADELWNDFNGTGYMDMGGNVGDAIEVAVEVPSAGTYAITFRYAIGSPTVPDRPMLLTANGQTETLNFVGTGGWSSWGELSVEMVLEAGVNTLRLANTITNGPNLDQVTVTLLNAAPEAITLDTPSVDENAAGAVIGTLNVSDDDATHSFTVSDERFEVADGTLKLVDGVALDFETEPSVTLTVTATDAGGLSVTQDVTVTVSDDTSDNVDPGVVVFDAGSLVSYTTNQDKPADGGAGAIVGDDGASLTLSGNLWKRAPLSGAYTITEDTRLEVTFALGTLPPEIVAIGIDADDRPFDRAMDVYQLGGTQPQAYFVQSQQAGTENADGSRTFVIDLSAHAGKTIQSLVFVADDDAPGNGLGEVTFSNISLFEDEADGNVAPRVVGGGMADFAVLEGAPLEVDLPFVDDDGDALSYTLAVTDADGVPVDVEGLAIVNGVLTGPAPAVPGTFTVTVTASDGTDTTSDSFTLTVDWANDAPVSTDPALEPYMVSAGEMMAGIELADFAQFFVDPDAAQGDVLTLTAENLPEGLTVNDEGVIVGTPTQPGDYEVVIRATDLAGLSDTLTILLSVDGPQIGDVVTVEAEDFTGLGEAQNFLVSGQAGASNDQILRAGVEGTPSSITTDLSQNGLVEGWYTVTMTRYDETDGSATFSLSVGDTVLAENAAFDAGGTFDTGGTRGNAGQAGNLKTVAFDVPVYVSQGTILTLSGLANGELLRTDRFTFTRIETPNVAPGEVSLSQASVAENAEDVAIGILSATDPDGDDSAIIYSVDPASPFEVVGDTLRLKAGAAFDFETDGSSVEVAVTATDALGGTSVTTLTVTITDVDEAPGAPSLDQQAAVAENTEGAIIGTLSAPDDAGAVTFTVSDPRFEVVNGNELKLVDGTALNFEEGAEVTVTVTADDGSTQTTGEVVVTVADANDAPVLPEDATLPDVSVAANAGASIDLAALAATDEDAGDAVTYAISGEAALAAGFAVAADGTTLNVPASAPAGSYEVTVVATDGTADSDSVSFIVTIGAPDPFTPFVIQAEDETLTSITLAQAPDQNSTQVRDPDNIESNPALETGLRPDFTGTGYLDFGNDAGDTFTVTVDVPAAGSYDLNVRYASSTDRPLDLSVNGGTATTMPFVSTDPDGPSGPADGFDIWLYSTVTVTLEAGSNTVSLAIPAGLTSGPNIDRIEITEAGTGPIPVDDSADADGLPLTLDGDTGTLTPTQAASINFNVSGVDDDIVTFEISFDGGATRQDVTGIVDSDGDFVVDGSGLAAGPQTATIIVTDAAGNEAESSLSFAIGGAVTVDPIVVQAEDETQVTVADAGAPNATGSNVTREVNAQNPDAFDNFREGAVDDAYIDFGTDPGDTITFSIDVPVAGTYTATIRYANGSEDVRPLELSLNGAAPTNVAFVPTTAPTAELTGWEGWTDLDVTLELVAGTNTVALTIPTEANGGVANGPNIDQITFTLEEGTGEPADAQTFEEVVKVNFEAPTSGNGSFNAPAGYTTPEGFEADTGAAFGDRGNGFTYGWVDVDDANGTVTGTPLAQPTGSMRYKNAADEASDLQKTYAHFDYPGAPDGDRERAWEIALEDGVYQVSVAVGDTAGQYDSRYVLNVEGQQFGPAWDPVNLDGEKLVGGAYNDSFDGEGYRSHLYTGMVEVTDGRLTLDGIGGDNVEIQWLDIERVPDLTPDDGRSADLDYSKFVSAVAASTDDGQVSIEIGADGTVPLDIDPTSSIVVGVDLQAIDHRGPNVAYVDGVRLYETLTGEEVAINVQVTGGADSLTIRPLQDLKEFTSYTLDIQDVLDLGNLTDSDLPLRQFQDYSTSFVTGEAPEVVAREVAFTDTVVLDGFADGGAAYTSIDIGPDGRLYVSTIMGEIHRWDINADGTLDKASQETLSLDYFQDTGRSIIGLAFDPEDPNTIWVSDNAPVPREGKADETPEFSGQVSKITLGAGGSFEGASAETYITGLPRSGGDHVTNSLEFRNIGTESDPEYLLYVMQGSNSAAGRPDNAWGFRPERLLNAAALEIDPRRDAPDGGFDVQTEPYEAGQNAPTYRDPNATFNADGTVDNFYNPFASDAVLKIFGEGIRNAYDLVWHSNGNLYVPTNGTARGGNTLDDPNTPINESVTGLDKQYDYLFQVQEGGYYGHPNSLLGHYVVNGGAGGPQNIYGSDNSANTPDGGNEYAPGVVRDEDYDADGSYSLGFNKSPNGATEYTGNLFGSNLKGAILFAQFSVGDNVRVINVDPVTGRVTGDDVLRRPGGDVIDEYIDPLDIIENPLTGQLYMMTLNRGTGESRIVLLNPAPGGVVVDTTADEGNDLALAIAVADPENAAFTITGADSDLVSLSVSFTDGTTTVTAAATGNGTYAVDLSALSGPVSATLTVEDDSGFTATASAQATIGETGGSVFLDATAFTVLSTLTGTDATVIRNVNLPSTHEAGQTYDIDPVDGLNDGYDGVAYLDPNGGPEDKASFAFNAPAAGTYTFSFRMAAQQARSITFGANGDSETVTVNTGSFLTWQSYDVVLTMAAGANTVVISQTGPNAPNIDSVTITPLDVADGTADAGGDLDLVATDLSDPANAVFTISGADADLVDLGVIFDDGTTTVTATPTGNGAFTADLSALTGAVTATLTVSDGTNTATETASFTLDASGVPNDGTETVGGVPFTIYEAENAALTGATDLVTTAEDNRGQSGGAFVDFDGDGQVSITWTVEVSQAGSYRVDFLYALATSKADRPMQLSVDGTPAQVVGFPANSNEDETIWTPAIVELDLAPGVHTLTLTATGSASPNIDYLRITSAPLSEPLDLDADEGDDLALTVLDQTDAQAVLFQVTGLDDDIETLQVAFNGGAPQTVTLDGNGQFTADVGIVLGTVDAVLTVVDDAANIASADASFAVSPDGNPNADIAIQSLDPVFLSDRLHFSFLQDPNVSDPSNGDRAYKDSATVRISNTGTEALEFAAAEITGPYDLADPTVFDGLTLAAGQSIDVTVLFDATEIQPKPGNGQNGVRFGELTLTTNDAEDPIVSVDLAGFWQARDEGGWEPNVNEVWQLFGFGNTIEGLTFQGGGESDELDFYDLYLPVDETEVLSPYWRLAEGVDEARLTQIAAFHGPSGATLGIHNPGNKGQGITFSNHAGDQNQTLFPLLGNGSFASSTFDGGTIPDGWLGSDIFGISMAGLSTDPRLNPSGSGTVTQAELDARYPGYTVTGGVVTGPDGEGVTDGYTVRMFQAVDQDGNVIENTFLGIMDYTGINYDYNDNMFVIEGVTPVGFGGVLAVSGLDDAAADDRLVFTNIENPNNVGGLTQTFRNEATFTLSNDGIAALDVAALTIEGADAGAFEIISGPSGAFTIGAGQSIQVTVAFTGADGVDDNAAVLHDDARLVVTPEGSAARTIALAGLAQLQSESGEEPTVAQVVQAFGYSTDMAQGQLANGGQVEAVGDEVIAPYLTALDGSQPVEVIQLAAFLQQTNVARLSLHGLESAELTELFAADDQQGQTVLPDGLVTGPGDTGGVARASFDPSGPFGLKVTVDGRPTYASWTDPEINRVDPQFGQLVGDDAGHLIRFFQAKDANGQDIPGTLIAIQDYPGAGNYDYNDHMFIIRNVAAYDPTGAEDANGNGVIDALESDVDNDGLASFFDPDETPDTGGGLDRGGYVVGFNVGGAAVASQQGLGGVALRADDDPLIAYAGDGATRAPGLDGAGNPNGANALPGAFQSYRDGTSWTVEVSGLVDGEYVVVLHTQETYWNSAGQRQFDIDIDGVEVANNIDPFAAAGGNGDTPVEIEALVQVSGGSFTVTLESLGADGIDNAALNAITIYQSAANPGGGLQGEQPDQQPFPGPDAPVFADGSLTVDASNYDTGGQGEAYNDAPGLTGGSNGGRDDGDVEQTSSGDIGWIENGDWYEYTIDVAEAGLYDLDLLLAFGGTGARSATVEFYAQGADTPYATTGAIANPSTGTWSNFVARSADGIELEAGEQVVRVTFAGGSQDFRSFTLTQQAPVNQAPTASDIAPVVVTEGQAIALDVSDAFDDPDGDALSYTVSGLAGLTIGSDGTISGTAPLVTGDTSYDVTVTASDGTLSVSETFSLTVEDVPVVTPVQNPFPGPDAPVLDGTLTVDATNFDTGGQGVSWNDNPGKDGGSAARPGTDVETVGAEGDIGHVLPGEWVEYTIDVAEAGTYDLSLVAKAPTPGATITVSLEDGTPLTQFTLEDANTAVNNSFGGTAFSSTGTQQIALAAGEQTLRFTFDGTLADNGYVLDMRSFTLSEVEDPVQDAVGQAGSVTFTQANAGSWNSVTFDQALDNPSVVMGPILSGDAAPGVMRVRNVTDTGFEYQLDEWDYLDGSHGSATVGWLAVEQGSHQISGLTIAAGAGTASDSLSTIAFGQNFAAAPVVLAQVASDNGNGAVVDRIDGVTTTGFGVALDNDEIETLPHGSEALHWVAVSSGGSAAVGAASGLTGNSVTQSTSTIPFGKTFEDSFVFLADMQTEDGTDPATVRLAGLTDSQASVFIEEEQSREAEIGHTSEVVGWVGLNEGLLYDDTGLL
ncbi:carbohydrate-binding protein [Roseivivax isoporae]|uniref:Carbohydrate-binding protein n=1 Tax=Roseivivax isoporae LMG 25204 TaxID=1449351 RepID=X7FAL4_9RHOB|nr:carbohydrate-binding protein [Roseivivax isoporae]ETX29840.1 hypothetical protein RISW2_21020 [Roseivivax isoporae LMG 25204]